MDFRVEDKVGTEELRAELQDIVLNEEIGCRQRSRDK